MAEKKKTKKQNYVYAVGRRKKATARVRLYPKKGEMTVNGKAVDEYFPGEVAKLTYLSVFKETGTLDKFCFSAKIEGSGKTGQLMALVHGLARSLASFNDSEYRAILKQQGFLTRDSRMKERRKVGTGGKARRKKQSPKR